MTITNKKERKLLDGVTQAMKYTDVKSKVVFGCRKLINELDELPANDLIEHVKKTVFSVGSNYVEGKARGHGSILQFLRFARGSVLEAKAQYIMLSMEEPIELDTILRIIDNEIIDEVSIRHQALEEEYEFFD